SGGLPATARGTRRRRSPGRTPPSGGRARPRSAQREVACYPVASSSPPSVSLLLTCREVARVDDVDRIVVVEDEHDLESTAGWGPPPHQPLGVRPFEWIRLPRCHHDVLGLFGPHAVAGQVFHVPLVPPELGHTISY